MKDFRLMDYEMFLKEVAFIAKTSLRADCDIQFAADQLKLKRKSLDDTFQDEIWQVYEPHFIKLASALVESYKELKTT